MSQLGRHADMQERGAGAEGCGHRPGRGQQDPRAPPEL